MGRYSYCLIRPRDMFLVVSCDIIYIDTVITGGINRKFYTIEVKYFVRFLSCHIFSFWFVNNISSRYRFCKTFYSLLRIWILSSYLFNILAVRIWQMGWFKMIVWRSYCFGVEVIKKMKLSVKRSFWRIIKFKCTHFFIMVN